MRVIISSLCAGIMIALGSAAYLSVESQALGALLLSTAYIAILVFNFHSFTGRMGYIFIGDHSIQHRLKTIGLTFLGNTVAILFCGFAFSQKLSGNSVLTNYIVEHIVEADIISSFVSAVFCGVIMFVAVHGYRRISGGITGCLIVVLSIMTFILTGLENAFVDLFFVAAANAYGKATAEFLIVVFAGNCLGAALFGVLHELHKDNVVRVRSHSHSSDKEE